MLKIQLYNLILVISEAPRNVDIVQFAEVKLYIQKYYSINCYSCYLIKIYNNL